ncbi:glycoside hydrolase family 43 protein [Rhodococcus sp. W8901]|uniref:glycoside hydrolase family 43 protein n=1 Tax=Rhodococcus sp. W8901 TaxID=2742603 RepID=UPI001581B558|nr:glycoside hydrolase family 43 protein [Rhodococcus sp. W8901]QKT10678.1 glycoside hydrolase family 43 protein [Rhodococcus sp. W8901]
MDAAEVTFAKRSCSALWVVMLCVAGLLVAASGSSGAAPPPGWRYTMVAFSNTSDHDMDVFESGDGSQFQLVQPSAYRPPSGLVRDPSIFRNADGLYYVTYTTGGGASIGFARSSDRVNWTHMGNLPVPFCCALMPGTGDGTGSASPPGSSGSAGSADGPSLSPFVSKAWAPEWFVDGDRVNVILSMSTGGGFVPYLMSALEPSLRQWSLPVPLAGIGADHIDTTVVKVGSTYHAFTKNETTKVIEHAVASSVTGPYSFVPPGNWGTLVEGPAVVQLPNGAWRIYLDAYTEGKYLYSDSTDGLSTWSPVQELPGSSGKVRHISVMREPV